ncbi:MAG TPA: hypothetical protein ACHBX0_10705 [Arsenophonus sp.]
MEPEIFESLVSIVLTVCPNDHLAWLKDRLMHK